MADSKIQEMILEQLKEVSHKVDNLSERLIRFEARNDSELEIMKEVKIEVKEINERVHNLETWKAKAVGIVLAGSAFVSLAVSVVLKLI